MPTNKLAAKLARLKPAPIVADAVLAALQGRGDLPEDVSTLAHELEAAAAVVAGLRERLADVPPVATAGVVVLL